MHPEWIVEPGGARTSFEPEAVSRDLFAAMERMGEPNSFLARELTDAVSYFLSQEPVAEIPRDDLTELIRKVVRELGFPELAEEYEPFREPTETTVDREEPEIVDPLKVFLEKRPPLELNRTIVRQQGQIVSRNHVYPRDLLSAAEQGLIELTDLGSPLELESMNLYLSAGDDLLDCLMETNAIVSDRVFLFGVERLGIGPERARRELIRATEVTGLHVEVRLNHGGSPPADTGLFATERSGETAPDHRGWLLGLRPSERLSVALHISEAGQIEDLHDIGEMETVFDRNPSAKMDTILTTVGMNLSRLRLELGEQIEFVEFLKKLGSLARLAKSVGHVRRRFLRKHARESALRGFRLERANLRIKPIGLAEVADDLAGVESSSPSKWVEMQAKLIAEIRQSLDRDRPGSLETILEIDPNLADESLTDAQRIRFASQLQNAGGFGTLRLPMEVVMLRRAWDTGLTRVRLT